MNIDDVKDSDIKGSTDPFGDIFRGQLALMTKYKPIEKASGVVMPEADWPAGVEFPRYNIDDPKLQSYLKDMFWRATEEMGEAFEDPDISIWHLTGWSPTLSDSVRHVYEELIDSLHFLTEACILGGLTPDEVSKTWENVAAVPMDEDPPAFQVERLSWEFIKYLGLAANTLKNKPWKQSHMRTDSERFKRNLTCAVAAFFELLHEAGLKAADIHLIYFKKHAVNQFRQRSKY